MEINSFIQSIKGLDYKQIPEKLLDKVFLKEYTLKSLDVSSRTLQSWFDSDLLLYDELKGKKHRFNFIDLIWLNMVNEFRKFGLPLKTIRKVKDQLFEEFSLEEFIRELSSDQAISILEIFNLWDESRKDDFEVWFADLIADKEVVSLKEIVGADFPPVTDLFLMLIEMILGDEMFFLTINEQGHVEEFRKNEVSDLMVYLGYKAKIVMPMNTFFYQYVEDIRNLGFLEEVGLLNKFEADLLKVIHSGDFDKVTIKFRDKKAEMMEFSKQVKKADLGKINNIVARKKYQEIIIKTESGDIRYMNVTEKVKIQ